MKFAAVLLATSLTLASAAPVFPGLPVFINSLTSLAQAAQAPVSCDVTAVTQPAPATSPLPAPAAKLVLVAIGRGTQNYTCPEIANATAVPTALGAVATLYNASCMASHASGDEMGRMTAGADRLPDDSPMLNILPVAGHHYFSDSTTAVFDLSNSGIQLVHAKKNASSPAPSTATNAVPWLFLKSLPGETSKITEVYRLQTSNGAAPPTCGTTTGAFTVNYSAEYWFYE